jgi:Leucine-rich repeat (LRR) protein
MRSTIGNNQGNSAAYDAFVYALRELQISGNAEAVASTGRASTSTPSRPSSDPRSQLYLVGRSQSASEEAISAERGRIATEITEFGNDEHVTGDRFSYFVDHLIANAPHVGLDLSELEDSQRIMLALASLSEKKGLETLVVDASLIEGFAPVLIEALSDVQANNPRLRDFQLILHGSNITDQEIGRLHKLNKLTKLDISDNYLTARSGPTLGSLRKLDTLNLAENSLGTWGVRELTSLTGLTILNLSGNQCETRGAKKLTSLTRLSGLGLAYNNLDDGITDRLASMRSLTALNLAGNRISTRNLQKLHDLPNIEVFEC